MVGSVTAKKNAQVERRDEFARRLIAAEVKKVRQTFELRNRTGGIEVTLGYQVANVDNAPGGHTKIDSTFRTTADVYYGTTFLDISSATEASVLVRFVWVVKSNNSLGTARVGGSIDIIGQC